MPGSMERLARLKVQGNAIGLLFRESLLVLDRVAPGSQLSDFAVSDLQMNAAWITRCCREMVAEILGDCGTRNFFADRALSRHALGVQTLASHYLVDYDGVSFNHSALMIRDSKIS